MMLPVYKGATSIAAPLLRLYLHARLRAGKEDPDRLGERMGVPSVGRPPGALLWVHAASVGESLSMLSLIERIAAERPGVTILMTSGTVSSARLLAGRLPPGVIHQFVPVDRPTWVRRFLDHWRPDLVLWVESEFWPNLLTATDGRGGPVVLVNARMSDRSFRAWRRWPGSIARLLGRFDLCLAQTEEVADKLRTLGAAEVHCPGNLKYTAAPLPADEEMLARVRAMVAGRAVWLAASTHPGEERCIAEAHKLIAARVPNLLTVVVPRHPARGAAVARDLGGTAALRSRGDAIAPDTAFYVGDTLGELGLFYRLSPVAFVGGSLVPHGGQNPLEPAKLGCAVVHGPHMENFQSIADELAAAGGAVTVGDAEALAREIALLIEDDALQRDRGMRARRVADAKMDILDAVFGFLDPRLDRLVPRGAERLERARA